MEIVVHVRGNRHLSTFTNKNGLLPSLNTLQLALCIFCYHLNPNGASVNCGPRTWCTCQGLSQAGCVHPQSCSPWDFTLQDAECPRFPLASLGAGKAPHYTEDAQHAAGMDTRRFLCCSIDRSDFRAMKFGYLQNKGAPGSKGPEQPFTLGSQEAPLYR